MKGGGSSPSPLASESTSHLCKELNLLFVRGLLYSSTADHSLWWGRGEKGVMVDSRLANSGCSDGAVRRGWEINSSHEVTLLALK